MKNKIIQFITFTVIFSSCGISHPPFDSDKADTKNNRFHYQELINLELTPDVKNLYTYGNEFGIDASYYIAFECKKETALKIIDSNNFLKEDVFGIPLSSNLELDWWNKNEIDTLIRYVYKNNDETYFKYFWYNDSNFHAYFLDFDL